MSTICPLCATFNNESIIWENKLLRIIQVDDSISPGFCRVIWNEHISEMSDLHATEQRYFMDTVFTVERVLRTLLHPDKINLASLGNQVPHLHWHIIPRFSWDSYYPDTIWSQAKREINHDKIAALQPHLRTLSTALHNVLT